MAALVKVTVVVNGNPQSEPLAIGFHEIPKVGALISVPGMMGEALVTRVNKNDHTSKVDAAIMVTPHHRH